jgi:large subunit ribosomal protein L35
MQGGARRRRRTNMPKLKTHRGAAKRFKTTGGGKIKRGKAYKSHILTKKSAKRKRDLDQDTYVSEADAPSVRHMLPYGSR